MKSSSPDELDLGVTVRGFSPGQKVFRRYSLVRILARGGMGVVWLARDDELEREVALKFLPDLVLHDRALLENLKAETRRSLELTHRHIVRIYDFVQDEDAACISMEYIDGDTLSQMRARRTNLVFDAADLQRYVAELCEALDYAHNRAKIVHRDIKPSNLMVNSRDEMKVADFGIARSLSDSVSMLTTRHTSGTLLYMSPQQLDGERTSHLDDVYSAGAVIYELLTSKPPFYSGQVDHQIRTKQPISMAERRRELGIEAPPLPLAWEQTVAACLAKNPAERPQSTQEIVRAISGEGMDSQKFPQVRARTPDQSPPELVETFVGSLSASAGRAAPFLRSLDSKKLGYVAASLAIAVLAFVAFHYLGNSTGNPASQAPGLNQSPDSPAPTPTQAKTGRLVVNTIPANASVYLDGSDRGRTPLVIEDITPGIHQVSIEASGYVTSSLIADVKGDGSSDFGTIHLVAIAPASTTPPKLDSPPPFPSPPSGPTRDLRSEIERFVYEHLRKSVNADISGMVADYADRVDYYENGIVDRSFIARDRQTYAAGWPWVKIFPLGAVRINDPANSDRVTISFDYRFDARNGKGIHSLGDAANIWVLDTSFGTLKIVSEKQNVTNRKRTR